MTEAAVSPPAISTGSPTSWLRALEAVAPIPQGITDRRIGRSEALRLLRCEEQVLDALIDHGLTCHSVAGEHTFNYCDVMNVGLYSQSGRSVAELAEAFLVRFAGGSPSSLIADRRWRVQLAGDCAAADRCHDGTWRLRRPTPELYGGEGTQWTRLSIDTNPENSSARPGSVRASLSVRTCGVLDTVRSQAVRELYGDALERIARHEWRFQYLPRALRETPDAAACIGAMDCMTTSLLLGSRCEQLGIEARTRKGYILSVNSIEHVWLEIRDDDDVFKPIDPMLAALALRHPNTSPEIESFMLGSISNRLLSWSGDAHTELFTHRCALTNSNDRTGTALVGLSATPVD